MGKLIQLLENEPQENALELYGPGNPSLQPTLCSSYRGDYRELAIEYEVRPDDENFMTVGAFLLTLKRALGDTFTGYKGGDFSMDGDTKVWLSKYSYSSGFAVIGVQEGFETPYLTFQSED